MSTIEHDAPELRGPTWPGMKAVIEARKAEMFAEQAWRPACLHCGVTADRVLDVVAAQAWWGSHRGLCVPLGRAA